MFRPGHTVSILCCPAMHCVSTVCHDIVSSLSKLSSLPYSIANSSKNSSFKNSHPHPSHLQNSLHSSIVVYIILSHILLTCYISCHLFKYEVLVFILLSRVQVCQSFNAHCVYLAIFCFCPSSLHGWWLSFHLSTVVCCIVY